MRQPDPEDASGEPGSHGRTDQWLPLLRRLSDEVPDWLVYKGADSAFTGRGDVDTVAPGADWPAIIEVFHSWAAEQQLGPVIVCTHVPNVLHLIALDPSTTFVFEMDVNRRKVFLGSTLFWPEDLLALSIDDDRGFRKLRPGVEGLMKLVQNGARRGGRPNWEGIRSKKIVELLEQDPEGVELGSHLFGRGAGAIQRLSASVQQGRWDRAAMAQVEFWCIARSWREPSAIRLRLQFRKAKRDCPVLQMVFEGRRQVPVDRESWLSAVRSAHEVVDPSSLT